MIGVLGQQQFFESVVFNDVDKIPLLYLFVKI
jgi:hypothetical protein